MRAALDAALKTGVPIVIDMDGVTFMDTTGIAVLVSVNLRAMRIGTPVVLWAVPVRIRNLLGRLGLEAVRVRTRPVGVAAELGHRSSRRGGGRGWGGGRLRGAARGGRHGRAVDDELPGLAG